MRWRLKQHGDIRTKKYFAWLPVTTTEDFEWRWLEYIEVEQRYHAGGECSGWYNTKFIN